MNFDYITLDCETTTHNKGHRFDPRNKLVSHAFKTNLSNLHFKYFTDPDFTHGFMASASSVSCVVGFNFKFDLHWCHHLGDFSRLKIWDCQLAEHVYSGQKAQFISLNECLEKYGLELKTDLVKEMWDAGIQTDDIPIKLLQEYNEWDVRQTEQLFLIQQQLLSDEQKTLVYAMGEDLKVLASIEANGLLFDKDRATQALERYASEVREYEAQLNALLPAIQHATFNWDSGDHLSCFLYGGIIEFDWSTSENAVYKSGAKKGQEYQKNSWHIERVVFEQRFVPLENTEIKKTKDKDVVTRLYQTDAPTLSSLKGSKQSKAVLDLLQRRSETQKVVEMLESLFKQFTIKGWENNLVHGTYNQNVAVTGRLSSSAPNMQNNPPELEEFFVSRYD
jgi:DNA polymerase I-like protein with 3'-5' exonuclease and polymerase domains